MTDDTTTLRAIITALVVLENGDDANGSRDFGRGVAHAVRQIRAAIADAPASREVTLAEVQRVSAARSARWHHDGTIPWTGGDWSNATMGEIGEIAEVFALLVAAAGNAANTVKKLRRIETGTRAAADPNLAALRAKLAAEIADASLYLPLLASYYGIDHQAAVIDKFNAVSEREGLPERLPSTDTPR